jgi:hypothetical protein
MEEAVAAWRAAEGTSRLDLRVVGDSLAIQDTRPAAARTLTVLTGPARLAYQALDAGTTVDAVEAAIRRVLGEDAPDRGQIVGWLEGWLADRLVMQEGTRYLSLATDLGQRVQLPTERFLAQLAGTFA